ncbi:MFS general substrate transporter [Fomitiporia mediterranea MF3/22]|uniref:MFS general substrate transporter n=1 Tax=Fomitiporia mediterranea (strain MF3/22) TaxID=694068 RepID=UPI0004409099|nr:MFS general substrate transporter [Fomitiporia mediterranea MF3/22]EJC98908.1 MFS general substrate transporter [Fomitiporia mediterranea MF3/22]
MRTPEDELEIYELPIIPAGNFTTAPPGADSTTSNFLEDTKKQRRMELMSFCALLWAIFMEGWNDGSNGPMLPAMQSHYHIGYTVVSTIFVLNCVGFVSGAVANIKLVQKIGFGATLAIGASCQAVAYAIQAPAPPFPLFAIAYIFSGFGISLQNAGAIVFVINLKNSSAKMGVLQAIYGLGALVSPLVATKFSSMPHWSYHYFVSLSGAIVNIVVLCLVFRFQHMDTILRKSGQVVRDSTSSPKGGLYGQIFKLKVVHLLAFFALVYVGAEVTLGGWIVTFVMDKRHGGTSSGYLSSGFFAGLSVGRLALLWFNKLIGERRVIYVYVSLCIALEITIWCVPSLIGNAIAVAFIGFLLGPIYPIITNVAGRLVPHWLLNGAVGWIGGFGQMGSALLPFITGALSSRFGVMSLQPLIVTAMSAMMVLWAAVPPDVRRSE